MSLDKKRKEHGLSIRGLSIASNVPYSTVRELCADKTDIKKASAETVYKLSRALSCSVEELIAPYDVYSKETGLPIDKSYLELGLPEWLNKSIKQMEDAWARLDRGEEYYQWDCDFCNLQTDINIAEVDQIISPYQAWYLREKYLGITREW